jgi:DNA-binding NarL/FixJ family response regulator
VRLCAAERPDIAILDVAMPGLNGVDTAREIGRSCPATATLLLTMYAEEPYVLAACGQGHRLRAQVERASTSWSTPSTPSRAARST